MKKKAQYGFIISMIIIILLVFAFLGLVVYTANQGEKECKQLCESYKYYFVSYEPGGYSPEECWCRTPDNKPERVS